MHLAIRDVESKACLLALQRYTLFVMVYSVSTHRSPTSAAMVAVAAVAAALAVPLAVLAAMAVPLAVLAALAASATMAVLAAMAMAVLPTAKH